jgi:hypothetical protein
MMPAAEFSQMKAKETAAVVRGRPTAQQQRRQENAAADASHPAAAEAAANDQGPWPRRRLRAKSARPRGVPRLIAA